MLGLETALSIVQQTMVDTGLLDWAGVAERMSVRARRGSAGSPTTAARSRWARRPTWCSTTPRATRVVDAAETASLSRNTPYAGRELPGRVVATFLRGRATVLDGKLQ